MKQGGKVLKIGDPTPAKEVFKLEKSHTYYATAPFKEHPAGFTILPLAKATFM
ncbi:MAG TPA: hypothetical protein VK941_09390 [Gillisia sp.]|nr:hypothetical protein [Gillisia sp.]